MKSTTRPLTTRPPQTALVEIDPIFLLARRTRERPATRSSQRTTTDEGAPNRQSCGLFDQVSAAPPELALPAASAGEDRARPSATCLRSTRAFSNSFPTIVSMFAI